MEVLRITTPSEAAEENKQQLDFAQFVRDAGEAEASHVDSAKCLVQLLRSEILIGTAALKTDEGYRNSCFKKAGVGELADRFPLELGYVVVHKDLRGRGLAYLLADAALSQREDAGVYATSNLKNLAMHKVLETRGFIRAGVPWGSVKNPGEYVGLFVLASGT